MKKIINKWNSISLVIRIICALVLGVIIGLIIPGIKPIELLGELFVGALKAIAPILVFFLVISSLAKSNPGIGKRFKTVIILYIFSTFLAAILAVIMSFLFPVTLDLTEAVQNTAPSGIGEVLETLMKNMVQNPVSALASANYMGILTWAVVFGIAFKKKASNQLKNSLEDISNAVSCVVKAIISLAPFGILGLVYSTISDNGIGIFTTYGKLILVLVSCMLLMVLVVDPLVVGISLRRNPYPLVFKCLKQSGITAFFTRSSAANIPVNMELCEELGLDKNIYSVCIPLGSTINMNGAAITITVMTLAAAHTLGISADIPTAIILSVLSAIAACGASGVAGGSLLLIPMACSLFGISNDVAMQVVGVGFIVGVVQDSFETAINSAGDVLYVATAEYREWIKEGKEIKF